MYEIDNPDNEDTTKSVSIGIPEVSPFNGTSDNLLINN